MGRNRSGCVCWWWRLGCGMNRCFLTRSFGGCLNISIAFCLVDFAFSIIYVKNAVRSFYFMVHHRDNFSEILLRICLTLSLVSPVIDISGIRSLCCVVYYWGNFDEILLRFEVLALWNVEKEVCELKQMWICIVLKLTLSPLWGLRGVPVCDDLDGVTKHLLGRWYNIDITSLKYSHCLHCYLRCCLLEEDNVIWAWVKYTMESNNEISLRRVSSSPVFDIYDEMN